MGMGMSLMQVPCQSQRQELKQKLEQKLEQQIVLKLSLEQYLEQEDVIRGFVRFADENNRWRTFDKDGFKFTYAGLPHHVAKPISDLTGLGFAHCWYDGFEAMLFGQKKALAQGDWTLFVVEDKIPPTLSDFVALHERGEELSLADHYFASKLEFAYSTSRGLTRPYVSFINRTAPSKFVDLTQKTLFPILPEELLGILNERGKRNEEELAIAEKLIKKHPLPTSVLRLMEEYSEVSEGIIERIKEYSGRTLAQINRWIVHSPFVQPSEVADCAEYNLREALKEITIRDLAVCSLTSIESAYNSFRGQIMGDATKLCKRSLNIPNSFAAAYLSYRKGQRLVTAEQTVEDRARDNNRIVGSFSGAIPPVFV